MPNSSPPGAAEHLFIAAGADHAPDLLQALNEGLPGAECVLVHGGGEIDAISTEIPSATGGIAVVGLAGAGLARAATPILLELIRSKRRRLRIINPDGHSIELDGEMSSAQLEEILDAAIASRSNPEESA
jgi:hypothetical protein